MRATDILRQVLDILDDIDQDQKPQADITIHQNGEQEDRFKSILAMLDSDSFGAYSNTPNEVVAPVDSVTKDAGGGVNGPKHPADIRVKDPRGFE